MAATTVSVSVEEYLRSSFDPDAEFIDGQIEERAAGEYDHSAWQAAACAWFHLQAKSAGIRVLPSLRVQVEANSILVPDVTILDRSRPIEQIITYPPVAVIEILSPADTLKRLMKKCGKYEGMGVRTKYRYAAGKLEPLEARAFDLAGSSARFDLDEIEKLID